MKLLGADIATQSGFAIADGEEIRAHSFRPRAQRPEGYEKGKVHFGYEGALMKEFRDHLYPLLVSEEIEAMAIEQPLTPDVEFTRTEIDLQANFHGQALRKIKGGGTTFATIFRIYSLVGHACEIGARLNIPVFMVSQQRWRKSFIGLTKAPKESNDKGKWLKAAARAQCEQLGIHVTNDDQSDAVGVVWWLRGEMNPRWRDPGQLPLMQAGA